MSSRSQRTTPLILPPLTCLVLQWTSEPYESIDGSNSNGAVTVKGGGGGGSGGGQSGDQTSSQGPDQSQDQESTSACTAPEPKDQKTV